MPKKKRVAITGTVGVPACYGGYETMVENMLDYTPEDVSYTVYCSRKAYRDRIPSYKGARLQYIPFSANGPQSLLYDGLSLIHAWFTCDTILALGNCGSYLLPLLRLFGRRKVLYHYDGFELKREKWNPLAKAVMQTLMRFSARFSDVHISDNDAITPMIRDFSGQEPVLIEYGGDGAFPVRDDARLASDYGLQAGTYCFNVCRIEPENNIHVILEAFSGMPEQTLVLVGNWNKSEYGRNLRAQYSSCPNIRMMDPIYDPAGINLLRSNCQLYIHPHSVGGTNPSLVEAMFLGLPIVTFDVVYNRATTEGKALYFTDAASLREVVRNRTMDFPALALQMKEIADRRYRWQLIAEKYAQLY